MFNPGRLTLARRRNRLTKKRLAELLGCAQKSLVRYENGEKEPSSETVNELSAILGFPPQFFYGPDLDEPQKEAASFRALSGMPARDRDAALSAGALAFHISDWVDERFKLPVEDLPEFKESLSPDENAQALRAYWRLGEKPISNLINLMEAKGVRVFSLSENTKAVDAFSMWRRNTPYVFLNTTKTAERSRFDAAHELGHLIMHKYSAPQGRRAEEEANQFASAFLMPGSDVRAKLPRVRNINEIIRAKRHWRVSAAALIYRLHKLGIISDWQYRRFYIQLSESFGKNEPNEIDREISCVWTKVLDELRIQGVSKNRLANELNLPLAEIDALLFRLTRIQTIEGSSITSSRSRAHLRVVGGG